MLSDTGRPPAGDRQYYLPERRELPLGCRRQAQINPATAAMKGAEATSSSGVTTITAKILLVQWLVSRRWVARVCGA